MSESQAVEVREVSIRYGKKPVLEGASLEVARGSVYALLGRNGSGKSSLVRTLMGMQRASRGHCLVLGEESWKSRARILSRVGFVAEDDDVEREMTIGQLVAFHTSLYPRWTGSRVEAKLERLGVKRSHRFGELSKGQRRQILLALALAGAPEILVLDDPTLGLDVVARKELYDDLLEELAERATTTLITSHDLAGLEGVADRVGILAGGKVLLDEQLETLKSRFRRIRRAQAVRAPQHLQVVRSRQWGEWVEEVVTNYGEAAPEAESFEAVPMSLEEIFIAVTGEKES